MMHAPNNQLTCIPNNEIPVLLTLFNRPNKVRAVIDNLRNIKPKTIFLSADGPRDGIQADAEKCRLARQELDKIDWECDIKIRLLDENIGCDPAVASAIEWFFEHVKYGIVLEDDCLVSDQFFTFCGDLLARYMDDERIMQISSLSPYGGRNYPYDYHFSRAFRCGGGWATWRRAWRYFTSNMQRYSDEESRGILKAYYPNHAECLLIYKKLLEFKDGHFDNWDFQWNMACYAQNGLCVVPERNMMMNIGFDEDSTHTQQIDPMFENLQIQQVEFPLRHPSFLYVDSRPETLLRSRIYYGFCLKSRCSYLMRQVIGVISYIMEVIPRR